MPTPKNTQTFEKVDVEVRIRARLTALGEEMKKFETSQKEKIEAKQAEFNKINQELTDLVMNGNNTMTGYSQSIKELEELLK